MDLPELADCDSDFARHRHVGLLYSPAAAALFPGIANRLAGCGSNLGGHS